MLMEIDMFYSFEWQVLSQMSVTFLLILVKLGHRENHHHYAVMTGDQVTKMSPETVSPYIMGFCHLYQQEVG